MKYQILKQYIPGNDSVWVGAIGNGDDIEIFDTLQEAEIRLTQLEIEDPTRGFKIVEKP
jgi:hypothetical protein